MPYCFIQSHGSVHSSIKDRFHHAGFHRHVFSPLKHGLSTFQGVLAQLCDQQGSALRGQVDAKRSKSFSLQSHQGTDQATDERAGLKLLFHRIVFLLNGQILGQKVKVAKICGRGAGRSQYLTRASAGSLAAASSSQRTTGLKNPCRSASGISTRPS